MQHIAPCEVGRWSDAESPDQGGWVVGRNGYPKVRVHVGKRTQPWGVGGVLQNDPEVQNPWQI